MKLFNETGINFNEKAKESLWIFRVAKCGTAHDFELSADKKWKSLMKRLKFMRADCGIEMEEAFVALSDQRGIGDGGV